MRVLHLKQQRKTSALGSNTRIMGLFNDDGNFHSFFSPFVNYQECVGFKGPEITKLSTNIQNFKTEVGPGYLYKIPLLRNIELYKNLQKALRNNLNEEDFDIIYAHNLSKELYLAYNLKRTIKKPLICEIHGLYEVPSGLKGLIRNMSNRKVRVGLPKFVDAIVAQTEMLVKFIEKSRLFPVEKISLVRNGVNLKLFDPTKFSNIECKSVFGFKATDTIVLYSGFLDEVNGVDFLLDVIKKVRCIPIKSVKFVLAGDGPFAARVFAFQKENSDICYFLGMVNKEQMPFLYGACDLFILPRPSHLGAETMTPLKLLEAMAMEKLILASDVGGIVEAMEPDREGIAYKKDDVEDCCRKLLFILNREESQFHNFTKNARQKIIRNYNWEESRSVLNDLYCSLISE